MEVGLYETLANLNGERLDFIFFFFLDKKETKNLSAAADEFFQHFLFGAATALHLRQFHLILNADMS